jgi:hypothetical protein
MNRFNGGDNSFDLRFLTSYLDPFFLDFFHFTNLTDSGFGTFFGFESTNASSRKTAVRILTDLSNSGIAHSFTHSVCV